MNNAIRELVGQVYAALEKADPDNHVGLTAATNSLLDRGPEIRASFYPDNPKLLAYHEAIAGNAGKVFNNEEIRSLLINMLAEYTATMLPPESAVNHVPVAQQVEDSSADMVSDLNSAFLEICNTLGYV